MKRGRLVVLVLQTNLLMIYCLLAGDWALSESMRYACTNCTPPSTSPTSFSGFEMSQEPRVKRSDEEVASNRNVYTGDGDDEYNPYTQQLHRTRRKKHRYKARRSHKKSAGRKRRRHWRSSSSRGEVSSSRSGEEHLYHQTIIMGVDSSQGHMPRSKHNRKNHVARHENKERKHGERHHVPDKSSSPARHHPHSNHNTYHPKQRPSSHQEHRQQKYRKRHNLHKSAQQDGQQREKHWKNGGQQPQHVKSDNTQKHSEGSKSEKKANEVVNMIINMAEMGILNPGCQMCAVKFLEDAFFGEFAVLANFANPKTLKRLKTVIGFVKEGQGKVLIAEAGKVLNSKALKVAGKKVGDSVGTGAKAIEGGGKAVAQKTAKEVGKVGKVVQPAQQAKQMANVAGKAGNKINKLFG